MSAIVDSLSQYIHVIGWSTLMYSAYRAGRFFRKLEERALALEENIKKAMTNDIPHIQAAMNALLEAVVELRDDVRSFLLR